MVNVTSEKANNKKLVEKTTIDTLSLEGFDTRRGKSTNKQARREPLPNIYRHRVKGQLYFYYTRGGVVEEYLGSADFIHQAVIEKRQRGK